MSGHHRLAPCELEHHLAASSAGFASALEQLRNECTAEFLDELQSDCRAESEIVNSQALAGLRLRLGTWQALSRRREDNSSAVCLMQDLIDDAVSASLTSDCLFWTAVAKLHLGEYREARVICERLALRDPERKGALGLHALIRARVNKDGRVGLAVVTGIVLVVSLLGSTLMRPRR